MSPGTIAVFRRVVLSFFFIGGYTEFFNVRRFLSEEEHREGGGRLERVVFCCFEAKDERAYGEWLP